MKKNYTKAFWALLFLPFTSIAQLATFDFPATNSLVRSSAASNVTVSDMALSTGTIETNIVIAGFPNPPYISETAGWTGTTQAGAKYFTFTITADPQYRFTITNIAFRGYATTQGPERMGFAIGNTNIYSVSSPDATLVYVNQAVTGQTDITTATIKIQGWLDGSRSSSGGGPFRLDDVVISGTVSGPCAGPSTQASGLTLTSATTTQMNLNWTRGNGTGGMLMIGKLASAPTDPASGNTYGANNTLGSGAAVGGGYAVSNDNVSTSATISGLTAETEYFFNLYEYNTLNTCYNISEHANSFFTLSPEPTAQPASFSSTTCGSSTLTLNFPAASGIANADGYVILRRQDGTNPTTTGITDGMQPSAWTLPAGTTVAGTVNSTSAISYLDAGLTGGQAYNYLIIPYNWDLFNNGTYNYYIGGTLRTTSGTTGNSSEASDIIANPSFTYNSDINYSLYQGNGSNIITNTTNSVGVFGFRIRDGGGTTDADALPTIVKSISFTVNSVAQTSVRRYALFDGTTLLAEMANPGTATVTFSGLSISATEALLNKDITLAVAFYNTAATITDNAQMSFSLAATGVVTECASLSSQMSAFTTLTSVTTLDQNRIEVLADRLGFVQQPSAALINVAMTPAVTVEAKDINNIRDVDFVASITITSTGTLSGTPVTATATAGLATFSTLTHTAAATITLNAERTGTLDWDVTSNSAVISNVGTGNYRSAGGGVWLGASPTATWERFNTPIANNTWQTSSAPTAATSNIVYIRHAVSAGGSFASSINLVVENSGTFTVTASSTSASITVNNGGILQINAALTNSGNFTVESGGRVNLNNSTTNGASALWNGTENFKTGSTFEVQNWQYGATNPTQRLIQSPSVISTNTDGYYFGNLIISGSPTSVFGVVAGSQTINLCANNFTSSAGGSGTMFTNALSNVTVAGNLIVTTGTFSFAASSSAGDITTTILGNIVPTGGTINLNSTSAGSTQSIVQLKGNLTIPAATTLTSGDAGCKIVFSGTAQTASVASTMGANVDFEVFNGSYTTLNTPNLNLANASNNFDVLAGGTLDFNGFNIIGAGDFSLASTGTLKITSIDGLNALGTNTGNVQTTGGTRTISQTGYFYFTGNSNPQSTGNALTSGSTGKRIFIDKTNATDVVNLTQTTGTTDQLTILKGVFQEPSTGGITGSGVLNISATGTYKTAVPTITVPQLTGIYTLADNSIIELNGTADQTLRGARDYKNLTFSNSGTKTVTSAPSSIVGTITVANSAILDAENNTMGNGSTNLVMTGTSKYKTAGTDVKPDAGGTYSLASGTTIEFSNTAASLENIRLQNPIPNYSNIIVSGTSVGTSTLTGGIPFLSSGTRTFTVKTGATFKHINTTGFSGGAATAINTTNPPTITLESNSTVEYNGTNQTITNVTGIVSGSATSNYANLTLSGTGTSTAPSGTLAINGNLLKSNTGTFAHNTGTVTFNNTTTSQTFSNTGTTAFKFYDLTNSNTNAGAGLSILNDLSIENGLNPSANSKLSLTSGNIILLSDNSRTAYINQLGSGAAIAYGTGKFEVRRYLPINTSPDARRWRLLTAPIKSTGAQSINAAWQEAQSNTLRTSPSDLNPGFGTIITRNTSATNGYDQGSSSNPSIFKYVADVWTPLPATTATITDEQGYMIFVRGNRNMVVSNQYVDGSPTTLRVAGEVYTGPLSRTLSTTNNTLIGNPYPSAISFNNVTVNGINPGTTAGVTFYLWDPKFSGTHQVGGIVTCTSLGGGVYSVSANGSGFVSGVYNGRIESGSAFVMPRYAGSINFAEASKLQTSSTVGIASRPAGNADEKNPLNKTTEFLTTNLYSGHGANAILVDGVVNAGRDDFDNELNEKDAPKLITFQTREKISILRDKKLISIELRKPLSHNDTIFYALSRLAVGPHQFEFNRKDVNPSLTPVLEDTYTNTKTILGKSETEFVSFNITEDSLSVQPGRFRLVFKRSAQFSHIDAAAIQTAVAVKWEMANELNTKEYEVERSADGVHFSSIGKKEGSGNSFDEISYSWIDQSPVAGVNYYRIKATGINAAVMYSDIEKVVFSKSINSIYVSPNPCVDNIINLYLSQLDAGAYNISVLDGTGRIMNRSVLKHPGGSAVSVIRPVSKLAAGVYRVELTSKGIGKIVTTAVVQ
ncbi:MAG: hypothetical protein QM791_10415 [Ferruginibacter sp.]